MKKAGLSEDLLIEVFQRLPFKSICKFKCLSKVWLSNLSEPKYIPSMFKTIIKEEPWAVFSNNHESTRFISSCMELSGYDGFSFSFLSESERYHTLHILASSNGLILCSALDDSNVTGCYIVCNPILKKSVSFPPPPEESFVDDFSYGLVCDTNSDAFKVVRIETCLTSNTGLEVEIYLSDLGEWKTYDVSYLKPRQKTESTVSNVITHDGVVYWIEEDYINRVVAYDLNKINNYESDGRHECNVFYVPSLQKHRGRNKATIECIGVSEDFICYVHMRRQADGTRVFRTWVLSKDIDDGDNYCDCDNENPVWDYEFAMSLPYEHSGFEEPEFWIMGFSPVDRHVIILADDDHIWTYDVSKYDWTPDSRKDEKDLCHPFSRNSSEFLQSLCVPLEEWTWSKVTQHAYAVIVTPTLTPFPQHMIAL